MQKISKKQKLIGIISIAIITIILAILITKNIISNNNQVANEKYLATTANAGSNLIASYIQKGVTIGGITGTLDVIDTSDATATAENIDKGKTAYVNGKKITGTKVPDKNYTFVDSFGNIVKVPGGFDVINPNDNVTDGIVIEDVSARDDNTKGNQFVWIPVGEVITDKNGSTTTIELGRYQFDSTGKATIKQSANNCNEEVFIGELYLEGSGNGNATAKNLSDFVSKTQTSGGYYIARYEAGDAYATTSARASDSSVSNPAVSRKGVYPYDYISQSNAANLSRNLYYTLNFESDLVNSYAWDTAIVFIQTFSGDTNYSTSQKATVETIPMVGESTLKNIDDGDNIQDIRCNIYDMTGATSNWSTETRRTGYAPCVDRSAANRGATNNDAHGFISFRFILYL